MDWTASNRGAGITVLDRAANGYSFVHDSPPGEGMGRLRVDAYISTLLAGAAVSLDPSSDYRLVLTRTPTATARPTRAR